MLASNNSEEFTGEMAALSKAEMAVDNAENNVMAFVSNLFFLPKLFISYMSNKRVKLDHNKFIIAINIIIFIAINIIICSILNRH